MLSIYRTRFFTPSAFFKKSVKVKGCRIRASGPVTRPACKRSSMVTIA